MALPPVPIALEIDPGIGRIVEAAQKIVERRAIRRAKLEDDFWADLQDDLQAANHMVREVNKLYGRVLNDIEGSIGQQESPDAHRAALDKARAFLRDDTLIALLKEVDARLAAASQDEQLNSRKLRTIGEALHAVHDAIEDYIRHLQSMQENEPQFMESGERRWTLAEVGRALEGHKQELAIDALCEQAIRNRRKDAVYSIQTLAGEASQKIKNRRRRRR